MPHDATDGLNPRRFLKAEKFEVRGYVFSEDSEFALRDVADGLSAVATMCDDMPGLSELPSTQMASLLRVFARTVDAARDVAAFTNSAEARSRHIN